MQLIIFTLFYWLILSPAVAKTVQANEIIHGENRIALSLTGSDDFFPTDQQLQLAYDTGITLLEVDHPAQIRHGNNSAGFYYLLNSPLEYYTPHQLEDTDGITGDLIDHYGIFARSNDHLIAAVNLLNYPDDRSNRFLTHLAIITDSLYHEIGKPLYYRSAYSDIPATPHGLSFVVSTVHATKSPDPLYSAVNHFRPSNYASESIHALETVLNRLLEFDDSIIILPARWFFERLEAQPDLAILFSAHTRGETVILPLPADKEGIPAPNISVILLFLILLIFAIHYRYQPSYPFFMMRYFFNHSFFVADIMENRLRNTATGLIMIFKHALLSGLFLYCLGVYFISDTGWLWITGAYPALFAEQAPALTLFAAGTFAALLLHFISVGWVFILNNALKTSGQVIHLYIWAFSLNVLFVSVMVLLIQTEASQIWVLIVSALIIIVWFSAFNTAAIDGARFLDKYQILNLFLSIGVPFAFVTGIILFILFTPRLFEPLYWLASIP